MKTCPKCGVAFPEGSSCIPCLIATGLGLDEDRTRAERIFRIALSYDPDGRRPFFRQACGDDSALLEELELLLDGYEEEGGDEAEATLGGSARERWSTVRREEPGTVIDHFRLIRSIGEGGMGSVWEAEQSAPIKRRVALKIIKLGMDTEEVVRRFERERRTLALMTHPHIAQVFEAGATPGGRPYFAMELVEGEAITTHCARQGLDVRARLGLFLEVCAAVEYAHQKGVIHRDLKPSNILVADGGAKVIDFGVAKATQDDSGDGLFTRVSQVLGTPAYMSPEQAASNGADVDTRTDVYSLGVVLYELLSGVLPFDPKRLASTHLQEVQRILREETPPRPSTRPVPQPAKPPAPTKNPTPQASLPHPTSTGIHPAELKGDLDWIVMKALSKERDRRYASAADFARDVRRFLNSEAVSAVPPTMAYRFGKFVRRNKAVAGIMVALSAGLVVSLWQVQRTNRALAGEAEARQAATYSVADMYTRSGLTAADNNDPTRAALWFANAAIIGAQDPERRESNRLRAEAWRAEAITAVAAFDTGFPHLKLISWNPRFPAMLAKSEGGPESTQIWNLERETRWHADAGLMDATWSPTGEWVAAVVPGPVLVILEYPSGKEILRKSISGGSPAWSPDSRWIVAGDELWDWRSGAIRPIPRAGAFCSFSRDGRHLLMQADGLAWICDPAALEKTRHEPVRCHDASRACFLGDGQRYAVSAPGMDLQVRDTLSGTLLESYPMEPGYFNAPIIAVSPDGRFAGRENRPLIDLEKKGTLPLPLHRGAFKGIAFSPDGTLLASGGYDDRMELWSLPGGEFRGIAGHHHTAVVNAAFSSDGRYLASGEDGLVRVWDTRLPRPPRQIPSEESITATISGDGHLIAPAGHTGVSSTARQTRAYHLPAGTPAGPAITPGGLIMDAAFSQDGAWLALATATTPDRHDATFVSGGGSGQIQFWNPRTGERLGEPIPLPSEPRGLCLHPTGEWLGVCCSGHGLEINPATRQVRHLFSNPKFANAGATLANGRCAYSPDGRVFATWSTFQYVHLWDRTAGRDLIEPFHPDGNAFDLSMTEGTAALALVGLPMHLALHDLRTGAPAAPGIPYTGWPYRAQFSQDGRHLLSAGGAKTAQIWDWRTGQLVCPALPHEDAIMAASFVPGTSWVVTGSHDGKIKFWDAHTGMMIRPALATKGFVLNLQPTPDARTLMATGYLDEGILLIDLPALFPKAELDPALLKLRAEIDADAEVHPGGGLAPLSPQAWLAKWKEYRRQSPASRFAGPPPLPDSP